jgi:hypothetical protein
MMEDPALGAVGRRPMAYGHSPSSSHMGAKCLWLAHCRAWPSASAQTSLRMQLPPKVGCQQKILDAALPEHSTEILDAFGINITKILNALKHTFTKILDAPGINATEILDALEHTSTEILNASEINATEILDALKHIFTKILNTFRQNATKILDAKSRITQA